MITDLITTARSTPSIGQLRSGATNGAAGALWSLSLASLIMPVPHFLTEAGVLVAMVLTLPDVSKALRGPLLACAAVLALLTLRIGNPAALLAGLDFAAPLAGFLVSVAVLRAALIGGVHGAIARGRFEALDPAGQRSAILMLSFAFSSVFLVGVFPLLAPLVQTRQPRHLERLAAASLFGGALAFLWSPFSVGTAFATAAVGIASGFATTGSMFVVALFGLAVGLMVHGRLELRAFHQAKDVVLPLLFPLGLAIAATLLASLGLSVRITQAVPLVTPLVVILLALRCDLRHPLASTTVRDAIRAVPACGGTLKDLTVFAVGFALAQALADTGVFAVVTQAVVDLHISSFAPAILMLLTLAFGLLGVPAIVCAGLVAAAASSLMSDSPLLCRLLLTSCAWSFASMLSVTSGTLTVVASTFGVALRPLVLWRNVLAIIGFGALAATLASFGI